MTEVWEWFQALIAPLLGDLSTMVKGAIPAVVVVGLVWLVLSDTFKAPGDGKGKGKKKGGRE